MSAANRNGERKRRELSEAAARVETPNAVRSHMRPAIKAICRIMRVSQRLQVVFQAVIFAIYLYLFILLYIGVQ